MNTQKAAKVTVKDKNDQKIFIRKCTTPELKAAEIYNALGYKHDPFVKKSVLPEMVDRKTEPPGTGYVPKQRVQVGLTLNVTT